MYSCSTVVPVFMLNCDPCIHVQLWSIIAFMLNCGPGIHGRSYPTINYHDTHCIPDKQNPSAYMSTIHPQVALTSTTKIAEKFQPNLLDVGLSEFELQSSLSSTASTVMAGAAAGQQNGAGAAATAARAEGQQQGQQQDQ